MAYNPPPTRKDDYWENRKRSRGEDSVASIINFNRSNLTPQDENATPPEGINPVNVNVDAMTGAKQQRLSRAFANPDGRANGGQGSRLGDMPEYKIWENRENIRRENNGLGPLGSAYEDFRNDQENEKKALEIQSGLLKKFSADSRASRMVPNKIRGRSDRMGTAVSRSSGFTKELNDRTRDMAMRIVKGESFDSDQLLSDSQDLQNAAQYNGFVPQTQEQAINAANLRRIHREESDYQANRDDLQANRDDLVSLKRDMAQTKNPWEAKEVFKNHPRGLLTDEGRKMQEAHNAEVERFGGEDTMQYAQQKVAEKETSDEAWRMAIENWGTQRTAKDAENKSRTKDQEITYKEKENARLNTEALSLELAKTKTDWERIAVISKYYGKTLTESGEKKFNVVAERLDDLRGKDPVGTKHAMDLLRGGSKDPNKAGQRGDYWGNFQERVKQLRDSGGFSDQYLIDGGVMEPDGRIKDAKKLEPMIQRQRTTDGILEGLQRQLVGTTHPEKQDKITQKIGAFNAHRFDPDKVVFDGGDGIYITKNGQPKLLPNGTTFTDANGKNVVVLDGSIKPLTEGMEYQDSADNKWKVVGGVPVKQS